MAAADVAHFVGGDAGWRANLALAFACAGGRTVVARRSHTGPLCIQRPFHPEDGACHVYLLHPPGGLAGGDRLTLSVAVKPGAAVLITTPAATKFYRSLGEHSVQEQTLHVADGASLEWLPLDAILFGGSRAVLHTRVHVARGARLFAWEMASLGRPLSGDHYEDGTLEQRTDIFVDGQAALHERLRWAAGDPVLTRPWGLAGFPVFGTAYVYPADGALLDAARAVLATDAPAAGVAAGGGRGTGGAAAGITAGATCVGDLLVVRALARRPETLRDAFESLWSRLRPDVIGRAASAPRIWRT